MRVDSAKSQWMFLDLVRHQIRVVGAVHTCARNMYVRALLLAPHDNSLQFDQI